MSYEPYQTSQHFVAPYLTNGFKSAFISAPKNRKLSKSKNGPKKEFILDGVRISVGETNTTQIKTRLERVHQYRLNNSFDIHHENMSHRPRKKNIRKSNNSQMGSTSFYILKEDENTIKKFMKKMRAKEEQVAQNIKKLVDDEFESLNENTNKRYKRIFQEVNKRIAPEKSGLQYANYLDPETLFKLETALKNRGKAPMNHENTSLEKPLDIPRKSAGNERREEAKNSSEPPLRKVRHRKLSSHDPEEEMKVRGIQRIYGNRSRSPEFQPVKIKHAPTRKLKSRINLRDENIVGLSYLPGELSRVSRSAANTPIEIPQEVSDKIARMKREENITHNTSYFPRTQFMTKISSQFSKMESQERPTETENINSGDDAYIALLKVQEKIDTSYTLLREKIIQSRGEMTPRGKTQERERPNTVASLNLINVKNITSGLSMNETSNRRKIINQRPYEKKPSIKRVESEGIKDYESEEINRSNKSIVKGRRADFASTPSSEKKDSQPNNLSLNFDELNTTKGTFRKRVLELNQEINKHEIDRLSTPGVERRIIHENLQLDNTSMGMTTPNTDYRGSPENKSDHISPNTEISHQDKGFKKLNLGTTLIPTSINEDILKDVIVPVRKVSFVKATKFDQN